MQTYRFLSFAATLLVAGTAAAQTSAPKLTIEQLIQIKHPTGAQWSADGRRISFTYDSGGVNNLWTVPSDGSTKAVALTTAADGQGAAGTFYSRDGATFYWPHSGGLLAVPVTGGPARTPWPSAANGRNFDLSPDGTRIAFLTGQPVAGAPVAAAGGRGGRGGRSGAAAAPPPAAAGAAPAGAGVDVIVHTLATNSDLRVAHVDSSVGSLAWSQDGQSLIYSVGGSSAPTCGVAASPPSVCPGWHLASPPEIGGKLIFVANEGGGGGGRGGAGGTSFTVSASGGTPAPSTGGGAAGGGGGRGGAGRGAGGGGGGRGGLGGNAIDATHTMSTRTSNGGLTRTTEVIDANGGPPVLLHEETASKFFSQVNATTSALSPDRKWLLYTSDGTGWDQIWVVSTKGGPAVQLTKEPGEHWRAVWSHDSKHIAWDANTAAKPGTRQIEVATIGDNLAATTVVAVTSGSGTNTSPQWSPDDKRILYQHTDYQNSADLYVADAVANAKPIRLTSSMPASIDKSLLIAPQLIHYPGPDGKMVPAWLFVPKNLDRTKKHAAIVWIHPDGVNMNYDGWHTDRNEAVYYEFHQYLLQQGYVVIAPDYRGSIGYGRDWRNDVYMDVGGNDAKDARMAATYLQTLGYVDTDRVGVWGLSYGGFFVLQAVTQEPTWFRAAVDVAGVADYALYYDDPYHGGWTTSRIGTPAEHPEVYAKAAPMSHVDQMIHPLLILHGTSDVNVPFIHSVLLMDHLLKAGKGDLVNFQVYPGELHYFDRSFVVRDAWQRVDAFFKQNLHPEVMTAAGK
jgi:dipeptidyl aminopeptidase/acylaminoacyl peptidase